MSRERSVYSNVKKEYFQIILSIQKRKQLGWNKNIVSDRRNPFLELRYFLSLIDFDIWLNRNRHIVITERERLVPNINAIDAHKSVLGFKGRFNPETLISRIRDRSI